MVCRPCQPGTGQVQKVNPLKRAKEGQFRHKLGFAIKGSKQAYVCCSMPEDNQVAAAGTGSKVSVLGHWGKAVGSWDRVGPRG